MISTKHRQLRSFGLSLMLHTLLASFLLLSSFFVRTGTNSPELRTANIVLSIQSPTLDRQFLDQSSTINSPVATASASIQPVAPTTEPPPSAAIEMPELDRSGWLNQPLADAGEMASRDQGQGIGLSPMLTEAAQKLMEADRQLIQSRAPVGEPASIRVFGSGELKGRNFVFVLDRSKSMGEAGLGVITRSRIELSQAIGQLSTHHRFQIIGYHDSIVAMSEDRLLPATRENKNQVADFIGNLAAFGGTQHENGILAGLAYEPDIIVLMTDGGLPELSETQFKRIRKIADSKTQIHCIQFGIGPLQSSTNFMIRLARDNAGTFRYIDVNRWRPLP